MTGYGRLTTFDVKEFPCPLCNAPMKARRFHRNHYIVTSRSTARQRLQNHLVMGHPELGPRERSLVLDRVCDQLYPPAQ